MTAAPQPTPRVPDAFRTFVRDVQDDCARMADEAWVLAPLYLAIAALFGSVLNLLDAIADDLARKAREAALAPDRCPNAAPDAAPAAPSAARPRSGAIVPVRNRAPAVTPASDAQPLAGITAVQCDRSRSPHSRLRRGLPAGGVGRNTPPPIPARSFAPARACESLATLRNFDTRPPTRLRTFLSFR